MKPASPRGQPGRTGRTGHTLVECAAVCAVVAVLAGLAVPAWRGHELRAARLDAVQSLQQIQLAQEQLRAASGLYATDLAALRGFAHANPQSLQSRYLLSLTGAGPDGYLATARAHGVQRDDRDCPQLTLAVVQGFARAGPSAACWNR